MIICLALAAAVLLSVWGIGKYRENKRISSYVPYDGIIKNCSFSSGGGMDGGSLYITAENVGNCILVTVEERTGPNGRTKKRTLKADPQLFRDLEAMVLESGMKDWGELEPSEFVALDAPVKKVSIGFTDGSSIRFDSTDELPESGRGLIAKIRDLMEKYLQD